MRKRFFISVFAVLAAGLVSMSADAQAMGRKPKEFPIILKVDFGPEGKPAFEDKNFYIERGTTPKEAVSQVFPVLSGRSCCSLREVIAIDGTAVDPLKNKWWVCELNGSRKFSPHKKTLQPGDSVTWKYIQNTQ